jgi:hypothetical protein
MKKLILVALGFVLLVSAVPLQAAPPVLGMHGMHGWGGHWGGGHRVVVGGPRWGWGWGGWYGWGPAYYGGYYYPGPYAYVGGPAAGGWTVVDTDVSPDEARVYLDGRYIGTADDFDGYPDYLYLRGGHYRLEFKLEGYETKTVEVDAKGGAKVGVNDKLHKIPGSKQYGSYDTLQPQGGLHRFFAKKSDGSDVVAEGDGQGGRDDGWGRNGDGQSAPPPDAYRPEDRPAPPPDRGSSPPSDDWRDRPSGSGGTAVQPDGHVRSTRLTIHAEPADAAVYLDDKFVGTGEEVSGQLRGVRVSPGRHSVTVSRPGFKDRTVTVEVSSGQTEEVEIDLDR